MTTIDTAILRLALLGFGLCYGYILGRKKRDMEKRK